MNNSGYGHGQPPQDHQQYYYYQQQQQQQQQQGPPPQQYIQQQYAPQYPPQQQQQQYQHVPQQQYADSYYQHRQQHPPPQLPPQPPLQPPPRNYQQQYAYQQPPQHQPIPQPTPQQHYVPQHQNYSQEQAYYQEPAPRIKPEPAPEPIYHQQQFIELEPEPEPQPEPEPEPVREVQKSPQQAPSSAPRYSTLHVNMFPLVSEYLMTAHAISWSIVCGRQTVEMYRMLVACAIACLYSILREPNVHPFIEIQVRLKLAALLSEESVNWQEANKLVSKGTTLAKSYNYYTLAMQLKYTSIKAMAYSPGTSIKTTLTMVDAAIDESLVLAEQSEDATAYFSFLFLKISVLFNQNTIQETNEAIKQLIFLQDFEGTQDNIAHLAFTMHALKLFQIGGNADEIMALLERAKQIEKAHTTITRDASNANNTVTQCTITLQLVFMRVICETLILVELCDYDGLGRVQQELFHVLNLQQQQQQEWTLDTVEVPLEPYIVTGKSGEGMKAETSTLQAKTVTVSWLSPSEANILAFLISGLMNLSTRDKSQLAAHLLQRALKKIKEELDAPPEDDRGEQLRPTSMSLSVARTHFDRLQVMQCHTLFLLCLERFLMSRWSDDAYLQQLLHTVQQLPPHMNEAFLPLTYYLSGMFFQASGNILNAIQFYIKIREHAAVPSNSTLYILATINLVLVLEGSVGQRYNDFKIIARMEPKRSGSVVDADAGQQNGKRKLKTKKSKGKAEGDDSEAKSSNGSAPGSASSSSSFSAARKSASGVAAKEQTLTGEKLSGTPAGYYRRELLRPVCANHPSPMIQWALHLLDAVYEQKKDAGASDVFGRSSLEANTALLGTNNRLSVLIQFAMRLNNFQVGTIVACVAGTDADMLVQDRMKLARRGLADAEQSRNALWGWMNGVVLETLQREAGSVDHANAQHQRNESLKRAVEAHLNRVD